MNDPLAAPKSVNPLDVLLSSIHAGARHMFSFLSPTDRGVLYAVDMRMRSIAERMRVKVPPWCPSQVTTHLPFDKLHEYLCSAAADGHVGAIRAIQDVTASSHPFFGTILPTYMSDAARQSARTGQLESLRFLVHAAGQLPNEVVKDAVPHLDCMRFLTDEMRAPVDKWTAARAAASGNVECLAFVMDRLGNVDDDTCKTVMSGAMRGGSEECVRHLTGRGMSVHFTYSVGCYTPALAFAKFLKNEGWTPNFSDVMAVAKKGDLDVLRFIIEACGALQTARIGFQEPVQEAAHGGHLPCMRYLIEEAGCSTQGAIEAAAAGGSVECIRYLVEERGCVVTCGAVTNAARYGRIPALRWMVDERAGLMFNVKKAIEAAAEAGHMESLRYFVEEKGAALTPYSVNILASKGHVDVLRHFVEAGSVSLTSSLARCAARDPSAKSLRFLISVGCPVDVSVAAAAAQAGNSAGLRYLCDEVGCQVDVTVANAAVRCEEAGQSIIDYLLLRKCPVDKTTLLAAIQAADIRSVRVLMNAGLMCSVAEAMAAIESRRFAPDTRTQHTLDLCLKLIREA